MIEASGLCRAYGGRPAVREVSVTVRPGEIMGLLGPNGAGKTTTMRLLLGLIEPDEGQATISGSVGYLPEVFPPYGALTVRGYLGFCARMRAIDPADIEPALESVDIADLARRPIARLSKGQRQRVGISQAVLGRPANLVLDEPTIGLDPRQVVDFRGLVRAEAARGAAVLISTHLLAEAAEVCDRVAVIAKGRVVAEEEPGAAGDLEARFLRLVGEAELS